MSDKILLLNSGRIEQQGTPEELYNRPQTQFTAEFMGSNNHLSGRVGDGRRSRIARRRRLALVGRRARRAQGGRRGHRHHPAGAHPDRQRRGRQSAAHRAGDRHVPRRSQGESVQARRDATALLWNAGVPMPAAATAIWSFLRTISGSSRRPQQRRRRRPEGTHCAPGACGNGQNRHRGGMARSASGRAPRRCCSSCCAIRDLGSIQRASVALGISYRNGWGLLESWSAELARPLIDKTRGRGTRLTELGELLLRCDDEVRAALDPHCAKLRERIDRRLGLAHDGPGRLTISASHDLALAAVRDAVNETGVVQLDVQFRGSIDSIDAMIAERCELAGFHVDGRGGADLVAPYRQRLHAHRHAIIRFAERRQGLLLSPGNPLAAIRALADAPGGAAPGQPSAGVGNAPRCSIACCAPPRSSRPASPATTRRSSRISPSRRRSPPARPTSGSASRPLPPISSRFRAAGYRAVPAWRCGAITCATRVSSR